MGNVIFKNESYNIRQGDKDCLYELSEFVVKENYRHHSILPSDMVIQKEVDLIYKEELSYFNSSNIFIVRNWKGDIIGSIRVLKWDRKLILPIQKNLGLIYYIQKELKVNITFGI